MDYGTTAGNDDAKAGLTVMSQDSVTLAYAKTAYTGKAIKPEVTVVIDGQVYKENVDYTVVYSNNINPGKATVTVTGQGILSGSVQKTFKISKLSNVIKAKNYTITSKGSEQKFKLNVKRKGNGAITFSTASKKITIDENGNVYIPADYVGKAKIKVKVAASEIYKAKSKTITVTVKPAKVSGVSLTYDAAKYKLLVKWKTVKSSGGYEIEYSSNADFKDSQVVKVTKLSKDNVYITVLDSEKTYYVRIRSYKKVSKKIYYSDWSKVKKINLKK